MSDIRFIQAQGDLLETAISKASKPRPSSAHLRPGVSRSRTRFIAAVVALVVAGGGVAAAAGVFSASTARLALSRLDCSYGTGLNSFGKAIAHPRYELVSNVTLLVGESPAQTCGDTLAADYSAADLKSLGFTPVDHPRYISCVKNSSTVSVYFTTGKSSQCAQLGLKPLPSGYHVASNSANSLEVKLNKLYLSKNCWSPAAFKEQAQHVLDTTGYATWRAVVEHGTPPSKASAAVEGRCGDYIGATVNDSLMANTKTLELGSQAYPLTTQRLIARVGTSIGRKSNTVCYSVNSIKKPLEKQFTSSGMTLKFALTTDPDGPDNRYSFGDEAEWRHWQRGCVLLFNISPSTNDKIAYVLLTSRYGTKFRTTDGSEPPIRDFDR